jgi:hypothetical protein
LCSGIFNITKKNECDESVIGLQENEMSTDRENGRGNKRATVTRGESIHHELISKTKSKMWKCIIYSFPTFFG